MLIDNHCHINSLAQADKESLFGRDLDGYRFIDCTVDLESTYNSLSLSQWYKPVYSAVGFHPLSGHLYTADTIAQYQDLIDSNPKIVAIGEVGLDYKSSLPLPEQEKILRGFIELGYRNRLPIIVHNRFDRRLLFEGGTPYILNVLSEIVTAYDKIVFHCFSYGPKFLEMVIAKGGFASFSLNILRGDKDILDSLKNCPLENLLFETDSPYMRVAGNASNPLDVDKVYSLAAEVKGVGREELEKAVWENARKLFIL